MCHPIIRTLFLSLIFSTCFDVVILEGMKHGNQVEPLEHAASSAYLASSSDDPEFPAPRPQRKSWCNRAWRGCTSFVASTAGKIVIGIAGYMVLNFLTGVLVAQIGTPVNNELVGVLATCQDSLAACIEQCPVSQGLLANVTLVLSQVAELLRQNTTAATEYRSQLLEQMAANITALVSNQGALAQLLDSQRQLLTTVGANITQALSPLSSAIATAANTITANVTSAISQSVGAITANVTGAVSQLSSTIATATSVITANAFPMRTVNSNQQHCHV